MLVSVLINNYNYESYLEECIQSVINQTYRNIEIILYDDKSNDNSLKVAEKYEKQITIIKGNKKFDYPCFNQGNAINKAFDISKGEIIFLLDSDDYFEPSKVEKVTKIFNRYSDVVLVQHALYEIHNKDKKNIYDNATYKYDYLLLYKKYRNTSYYNPTSALSFRRHYLNKMLPIKVDNYSRVWPDVRLSRPAPYFGKVYSLQDCLGYYRRHNLSDSYFMNRKPVETLINYMEHHKYLNSLLSTYEFEKINYFFSYSFYFNLIKCLIPTRLLILLKKYYYLLKKKRVISYK